MAEDTRSPLSSLAYVGAGATILGLTAAIERAMGRGIWGVSGEPGIWSGDVNSSHNSQYLTDPYSFSHLTHGILFYGLTWMIARKMPRAARALIALAMESAWEVFENTNMVIERYRAATYLAALLRRQRDELDVRHSHLHGGFRTRGHPAHPCHDRRRIRSRNRAGALDSRWPAAQTRDADITVRRDWAWQSAN